MIKCDHCSMVFDVIWVRVSGFSCVDYCPFCASEDVEDVEEETK